MNYTGRKFEVLIPNTLFPKDFTVTSQSQYCVVVKNDTESYPMSIAALEGAMEWKKIRHVCSCGAKGFAPALGQTAMGAVFDGCDFCCGGNV